MVNITVYQTGEIMGDNGKIIGYEGQTYSETITVVHPVFSGAEYYIDYKYNQTIFRDKLDSYNRVKLKLEKAGYLTCQLVAIDILTGNILFKSNTWRFLVQQGMKLEPSHYPCHSFINGPFVPHNPCNHSNYHSHHTCNCNDKDNNIDSYKAYYDLLTELRNEEEIRYKEMQNIYEELRTIKSALNINKPTSSILDANEVIENGSYIACVRSINFPSNEQEYVLTVSTFEDTILQEAHETDGDNIWYRTGSVNSTDTITWTDWAQKITRVQEI